MGLARADDPFFMTLSLQPGEFERTYAYGVTPDGSVVVGTTWPPGLDTNGQGFRWTVGGPVQRLGYLPGYRNSPAMAISADGSIIAGYAWEPGGQAYRWTSATGIVGLGYLPGGEEFSEAMGISHDGAVIVGTSRSSAGFEAFRWTEQTGMVGLGDLPGGEFRSWALDVSARGSVVVGFSSSASGNEAFRWTAQTGMLGLGDLPGGAFYSTAFGVNDDGSTIVGHSSSANSEGLGEAFLWTESQGMIGLGELPGGRFESHANAASADGSVVVGWGLTESAAGGRPQAAFIWDAQHGMRELQEVLVDEYGLNLDGWDLSSATDISADGLTIVGYAFDRPRGYNAWVARIPEPATALPLAAALWLLAWHRRFSRSTSSAPLTRSIRTSSSRDPVCRKPY
jgi:probable HAF family extracellular repeat protein